MKPVITPMKRPFSFKGDQWMITAPKAGKQEPRETPCSILPISKTKNGPSPPRNTAKGIKHVTKPEIEPNPTKTRLTPNLWMDQPAGRADTMAPHAIADNNMLS